MPEKTFFILYDFSQSSGGGKNFLSCLKKEFIRKGIYSETAEAADVIVLNSHLELEKAQKLKSQYNGKKTFLHRIDGPMRIYNHPFDIRDYQVQFLLNHISDGVIFQSEWSKKNHELLYGEVRVPQKVVHNAVDPKVFNPESNKAPGKIKIIGSAWSHQKNKGGDFYDFLDENLDFTRFDLSFAGKTLRSYKNIECLGILDQNQLAKELRKADIYFSPSLYEACSNSLLEGIASGLIPIIRGSSSNPEIVSDKRLQFKNYEESLEAITNLDLKLKYNFLNPSLEDVANEYINFGTTLSPSYRELDFEVQNLQLKLKTYSQKIAHSFQKILDSVF